MVAIDSCKDVGLITFLKTVFMALMKRRLSKMFSFVIATEGLPFFLLPDVWRICDDLKN